QIEGTSISARYAVVQYASNTIYASGSRIDITVNFTSNASTAKGFNRKYPVGSDFLNETLGLLNAQIGATINPRAGCVKHLIIFTDASDYGDSFVTPFTNRNVFVTNGWIISVVKYAQTNDAVLNVLDK